ncbi:hypothetical protein Tco_0557637, partial [Tanacetum coccineum]
MPPKKTSTSEALAMTQATSKTLAANLLTSKVRKALLVSFAGLKDLNQYSHVATVPKTAR